MTTVTADEMAVAEPVRFWTRERRLGLGITICGLIATVLFGALATSQEARFTLAETTSGSSLYVPRQLPYEPSTALGSRCIPGD